MKVSDTQESFMNNAFAFHIVYMFGVLSMNMCYFCWFVQAYAAARFAESCIRALDGDSDVYECAYVQSEVRT